MANKIKAHVYVNDTSDGLTGLKLNVTDAQAAFILETVVAGETLNVNLVTGSTNGHKPSENPAAYAEQ